MKTDLENRIDLTPLSTRKYLYPLFEAIANSIQAIAESKEAHGQIDIHVIRDTSNMGLGAFTDEVHPTQPIIDFVIVDNGVGFNDDNFESFNRLHSRKKRNIGGKGIGRLLWLKAFDKVEIESVYKHNGSFRKRSFDFQVALDGVGNVREQDGGDSKRGTRIRLAAFKEPYAAACSQRLDVIVRKILSHFLDYFITGRCPKILLHDEYESEVIDLNKEFQTKMLLDRKSAKFSIRGTTFRLDHLQIDSKSLEPCHQMSFCAQGRVVEQAYLQEYIPALRTELAALDGKPFYYQVLVHSDIFEGDGTDWERTKLNLPEEKDSLINEASAITREELFKKVVQTADKYLQPYLAPLRKENTDRIKRYIEHREPRYRPLAKHRSDWFDSIPPNVSDESLSVELYRLNRQYELETKTEMAKLKRSVDTAAGAKKHKEKFSSFLSELNDQAIASLADYVVHRRAILEFLRESIRQLSTGGYVAEKYIHQIICPLNSTSDSVSIDQMNLWIIDEKLNFHHYLSSDRQQRTVDPIVTESADRADIILFNHALAFADDSFGSIVIVEFKRPMREDYSEEENPIAQVIRYVNEITGGKALTRSGRPMPQNIPIYAYLVCDITARLREYAKPFSFTPLPDQRGYFTFFKDYNMHMEIISFDKLVDDAEKRNAAFFEKLHLPPPQSRY